MVSRTERTPSAIGGGRSTGGAGGAVRPDARRHHPVARREPAGCGAAQSRRRSTSSTATSCSWSPTVAVLLATSFLSPRQIRRVALVVFLVSLVLVAMTPFFGAEIKGARRWLVILGVNIQPSEFLKPAFVILIAWLFARIDAAAGDAGQHRGARRCCCSVVTLLVLQPDFGQTMLIALVWGALFFMAGMRLIWVGGLARPRRRRPGRRLFHRAARGAAHPALHGSAARATPSTSTSRWNASRAAAGSAAGRARARSSASCPRATPTSSSRSARRNSASCSA